MECCRNALTVTIGKIETTKFYPSLTREVDVSFLHASAKCCQEWDTASSLHRLAPMIQEKVDKCKDVVAQEEMLL
jgi:hypothetical protein